MTQPPRNATDRDDLVDRGPAETLAPSRTALVLVGLAAVVLAILAGVGVLNVSGRQLDQDESLVPDGPHPITVGPVTLEADVPGQWVQRTRCDRWVQLADASDDATTLHVVWLDAVPEPASAGEVTLLPTPDDVPAWWADRLGLAVTPLGQVSLDGRPGDRFDLAAGPNADRLDGLVACGDVGGPAGTGMFGPAARFEQQVVLADLDGTPLLLVAAAFVGGDLDRAAQALDEVLSTGTVTVAPAG